jgi:hypothetical protein
VHEAHRCVINIRIARAGLHIREIPSFERERIRGKANPRTFRDGGAVLRLSGTRNTGCERGPRRDVAFLDDDATADET